MADTPDQRPNDRPLDSDRSDLPPDLLPVHDRLIEDGRRWRRHAPDGRDLPAWSRTALLNAAPPAISPASGLSERRLDALDERASLLKGPRPPMDSPSTNARARWRGFAGAAAATIVVGLLAALLVHNASQRGTGAGHSTVNNTPAPNGGSTVVAQPTATFLQAAQLPLVAPSDTNTVYRVTTTNTIQRSTDGGKHFTATAQPNTGLSSIDSTSLAVSPLNANVVFFNAVGKKNDQGCQQPSGYGALSMHGGILASGYIPCSVQMISTNGGQTWRALALPTGGVLGGTAGFRAVQFTENGQQTTIVAQGQRLFSAVAFASQGGTLLDSEGARIVVSDDGGATWKLFDNALIRAGLFVCDFAVAPTGQTVYATTSTTACANESFPAITLWRSDFGLGMWARVRQMPTLAEAGMVVSRQGWLYTFTPDMTVQGHGASATSSAASAVVSPDNGRTFSPAPSAGLPKNPVLSGPYATLSDGSVLYAAASPSTEQSPAGPSTLYAWKPGDSAWTKVSGPYEIAITAVVVTPSASGGDTLIVITTDGGIKRLVTPR